MVRTRKIGFEVATDAPYNEGGRWIEVSPPDGTPLLVLSPRRADEPRPEVPDELPHSPVFFTCDDIEKTHRELSERGVAFPTPPAKMEFGWWALFEDDEGTRLRARAARLRATAEDKGRLDPESMTQDNEVAPARIVVVTPRQATAAGGILARSHAEYPSFRHLFPDPGRRARALAAIFTGVARDAARLGSAYGALGSDGELHGVAIWLPPGRFPWSAVRQLRGAGWMLSVLRADRGSFRAFMETGANGARLHPPDQHWYLETMGVDPAVQRQGLGGRLIEPMLTIADRD
jgi:ribosomal protein S18 acetylase RimI-like enzyme